MRLRLTAIATVTLALAVAAWAPAPAALAAAKPTPPCGTTTKVPHYKHVIWIWMANESYKSVIGSKQAPYINGLVTACGLATNYHNISHKALTDYVGATSGLAYTALAPFDKDCAPGPTCETSAASVFSQGETWKAYQESMPSNCSKTDGGGYLVRHNPVLYYSKLKGCGTLDVPFTELTADLAGGKLPAFSFITPNARDDMHSGSIVAGDTWLAANLPAILASPEYKANSVAVFITWDQGQGKKKLGEQCAASTTDPSCHVAALVISPSTRPGTRSATLFSHYSLLATAEQLLGLPKLRGAATATTMTSAFHV